MLLVTGIKKMKRKAKKDGRSSSSRERDDGKERVSSGR